MQMLCWIDRITADFAVLCTESGAQLQLPAASLPQGAAAGDWGRLENGVFTPDPQETARRADHIDSLLRDLLH